MVLDISLMGQVELACFPMEGFHFSTSVSMRQLPGIT